MDNKDKNKWRLRGAVLGIFLLGFAAGTLFLGAYQIWFGPVRPLNRQARFEQTIEKLNLKDEQKTQVRDIFNDTRTRMQTLRRENAPRMQEIRQQTDARLQEVLTNEQWQQFQRSRNEFIQKKRGGNN